MATDSGSYTPDVLARRYAIAQALMKESQKPIESWTQGLANLANAGMSGYEYAKVDAEDKQQKYQDSLTLSKVLGTDPPKDPGPGSSGAAQIASLLGTSFPGVAAPAEDSTLLSRVGSLFGGGSGGAGDTPPAAAAPAQAPMQAPAAAAPIPTDPNKIYSAGEMNPLDAAAAGAGPYAAQIASVESGGSKTPYGLLGPVTKTGDRAYGKYQVMGSNVGPWTKEILGQQMTPQEFAANPQAQDAVFQGKFGQYVSKYGNPQDAASAWFTGGPLSTGAGRRDQLGTSGAEYVRRFNAAAPGGAAAADGAPVNGTQAIAQALQAPQNDGSASGGLPALGGVQVAQAAPAAPAAAGGSLLASVPVAQRAAIAQALTSRNPGVRALGTTMLTQATKQQGVTYQTTPDGTILQLDPTGRTAPHPVYQAATKPTFQVTGEDANGNKTYGFVDPAKQAVTPYAAAGSGTPGTITGPDGKQIAIPAGNDAKAFRTEVTKANADAATGKGTEVQQKAGQFADRMQQAEEILSGKGLQTQGVGAAAAIQSAAGGIPLAGSFMQTPSFQKYDQAKSEFITSLLRQESGAAIGKDEFTRYEKEFFPQPGNPPEVVAQKAAARATAIEAMKRGAGPAYNKGKTGAAPAAAASSDDIDAEMKRRGLLK